MCELRSYASIFLRKQLTVCGYAGNMRTFGFGPYSDVRSVSGRIKYQTDLSLHVQCSWRIVLDGQILVGCSDWWRPTASATGATDADWDPASGGSEQDEILRNLLGDWPDERKVLLNKRSMLFVTGVDVSDVNDVKIQFDKRYVLELFADGQAAEHWRIVDAQLGQHLIFEGNTLRMSQPPSSPGDCIQNA